MCSTHLYFCTPETIKMAKQTSNRPERVGLAGGWRSWSQLGACSYNAADIKDMDANLMPNVPKCGLFSGNWDESRISTFHVGRQSVASQVRNHCDVNDEEKSWFLENLQFTPSRPSSGISSYCTGIWNINNQHSELQLNWNISGAKITRIWISLRFEIKTVIFLSPIWQIIVPY